MVGRSQSECGRNQFLLRKLLVLVLIAGISCTAAAAPPNDDCASAIAVTEGVPYNGSTVGATGTDISECANNDWRDVWHSYTPSSNGFATVSLCGSSFDTTLSVFDDCGGTELACNDDFCGLQGRDPGPKKKFVQGQNSFAGGADNGQFSVHCQERGCIVGRGRRIAEIADQGAHVSDLNIGRVGGCLGYGGIAVANRRVLGDIRQQGGRTDAETLLGVE